MCKTRKAILVRAKAINAISIKCCLDVVAHGIIVASIICSYTEKLSYIHY
jgi:hypothetical protein